MKKYLFNTIQKILYHFGFKLNNIKKHKIEDKISDPQNYVKVREIIVEDIFNFFDKVHPFYGNNVREELMIGGAWKEDLLERRPNQLKAIKEKDKDMYSKLLENMFRNEMISGMFSISYYDENLIGNSFPEEFEYNLFLFKYITNMDTDKLYDGDFGNKWGLLKNNKVITLADPYKGINTYNIANLLNTINNSENICYMDLGSGYGSDALRVSKLSNKPTRIILFDIPLNLTTAFAYISMNTDKKCFLISSISDLDILKDSNYSESHFIFIPTIFAEELSSINPKIKLIYNHGSFSEMDYETVEFYLKTFLTNDVKYLFEINSNESATNAGGHIEVKSSLFPLPSAYKLLKRSSTSLGHRYLESLYIREN